MASKSRRAPLRHWVTGTRIQRLNRGIEFFREEARRRTEDWLGAEERLDAAAARFQAFYDDAPIGYLRLSRSGKILQVNRRARSMLGAASSASIVGKPIIVFVDRADARLLLRHLMRCRGGEAVVTSVLRFSRAAMGANVQLASMRALNRDAEFEYDSILLDVSEPMARDRAVRESERRYRTIVETAQEGVCITDEDERITFANRPFARMLGSGDQLLGRALREFVPVADSARLPDRRGLREAVAATPVEVRLQRLDGTVLWTSVSTTRMFTDDGRFAGMLRMFADITERKALEATRVRLVNHLVAAQEAERRRIARELHDQTGQHLVGLTLGLNRLAQPDVTPGEMQTIVDRLKEVTAVLSRDVHNLAVELRPSALDDLGLAAAVSNYADTISHQTQIRIDVHCVLPGRLDPSIEITVYRIVQEALTNIVRHSGAEQASVIIERDSKLLRVVVEDDGIGFDAGPQDSSDGRLGVAGMRERASLVGGDLSVESTKGHGTTVFLRVPLDQEGLDHHEEAAPLAG